MIISYRWLKEIVDLPVAPAELADVLTFLGLEVERIDDYQPKLDCVVIGEILECAHIEGTDHLSITKTNIGGEVLPIVCGAPNARAGLKVAVMLSGSETADGMKVKKAKLRGYESFGMLASERELGLADEHSGIIEGDADWIVGSPASKYLDLGDTIYDVEITPNRPDYLSHVGVARDLAAKFRIPWRWPDYPLQETNESTSDHIKVEIHCPDGCPRYAARIVRGVKVALSPFASRLRLIHCGVRPISNIVDATNLLMLEFGQPLHAFDMRFIEGGTIVVRYAADRERFTTLDGKEHELTAHDVMIADQVKSIGVGGVMGGLNSEIRDDTQDVLIECAYFDPIHIRRTSRFLGLNTDASRRFERGTDPNGVPRVINATASLIKSLGSGQILNGIVDCYPKRIEPKQVSFRPKRVAVIVGTDVNQDEQKNILTRLGCEVETASETWQITCPTHRPDFEREIDLVEEIIRVHGYDNIPTAIASRVPLKGEDDALYLLRRKIVDIMVTLGFLETLSVSMLEPNERLDPPDMPPGVKIKNPVTDEMPIIQGSLLPHLVRAAAANWRRGDRDLRLFEVARVFHEGSKNDPRTWEHQTLAVVMTGQSDPVSWGRAPKSLDFYDLKGVIEVLASKISLDKVKINCYDVVHSGVLKGELLSDTTVFGSWGLWPASSMSARDIDADVYWFEVDLESVKSCRNSGIQYQQLPKFPQSWRDIAVVVDEAVTVGSLLTTINQTGGQYLISAVPVDVFRGEKLGHGKKSIAIRLEFSHPERSLESAEVDEWIKRIVEGLNIQQGAVLR